MSRDVRRSFDRAIAAADVTLQHWV
jgi:hypothetical protein